MTLIRINNRIVNLDNLDYAEHRIYEDKSYVLLHFQGANRPLQLRATEAESIWQFLEDRSIYTLIEQVEPGEVEPAIAS